MSRIVDKLECPNCGGDKFLEGPHGGAAVNIKCANCGYWMNVYPLPRNIPHTYTLGFATRWWITEEGIGDKP